MGLRNQPEFEPMEQTETSTETATKEETMTTTTTTPAADAAKASASAAIAIAQAAATSVAVARPAAKFSVAFADKNNVFDTATVEGLSLAAPRVKGEQGSLFLGDEDIGEKLQFELISFNHRWAVGNGENDKESKDHFRVSYDQKTISGDGGDLHDYLESLKAQGFDKARISPYMDIWGFVTWSDKKGDIPVDERQLACIQASQTSMGAFTAFATTRGLLESRGLAQPMEVVEVHAEKRQSGSNKYTNFSFHVPKAK